MSAAPASAGWLRTALRLGGGASVGANVAHAYVPAAPSCSSADLLAELVRAVRGLTTAPLHDPVALAAATGAAVTA